MKHFTLALIATALCTTALAQSKVKNVYAYNDKLNIEQFQNTEQTVQLSRYFFAGYNTLCLPMTVSAEQLGDVKVERFAGIQQEGNVLNLYFVECTSDGIQAGLPYLVYSPKSQYLRVKNSDAMTIDDQLRTVCMSDNNGNTVTFGSAWETIEKEGRYGIPAQQDVTPLEAVLVKTHADKKFLPTRCGFTWNQQNAAAKELRIVHLAQGEVTAIKGLNMQNSADANLYDLNGRKVSQSGKGIYVQEGKKVVK